MIKNIDIIKNEIQLAVNAYKVGDLPNAELMTKKLIKKQPKFAFLHNLFGLITLSLGRFDESIESYKECIKLDPNFALAYNNLGLIYSNHKNDIKKSELYYKKSISLDSKLPEPHINLGSLYNSQQKFKEALASYQKAISINNKIPQAYHNIGNVYITIGNFEDAKKNFRKAIELNSSDTNSMRALSRLITFKNENDLDLYNLNKTYNETKSENHGNKINLAFSLGKAYEDIKNYNKSFKFYKEANFLTRKKINFSILSEKNFFSEIKKTYNASIFEKYKKFGNKTDSPIFILGLPRSGTTLVEQIISNHPAVYGCDEIESIPLLLEKNFSDKISMHLNEIVEFKTDTLERIGRDYMKIVKNISNNSPRITDKLPKNFLMIGFIKLILPNSKILHCSRNPNDNCFSIFKNHFPGGKINYAYSLKEIVEYYNLYSDLMRHWNSLLPNFILNITYENLILDTEKQIKEILKFCDLSWSNECLDFHKNKRPIKTASDVQARSKIYKTSLESWKLYEKYLLDDFNNLMPHPQ